MKDSLIYWPRLAFGLFGVVYNAIALWRTRHDASEFRRKGINGEIALVLTGVERVTTSRILLLAGLAWSAMTPSREADRLVMLSIVMVTLWLSWRSSRDRQHAEEMAAERLMRQEEERARTIPRAPLAPLRKTRAGKPRP